MCVCVCAVAGLFAEAWRGYEFGYNHSFEAVKDLPVCDYLDTEGFFSTGKKSFDSNGFYVGVIDVKDDTVLTNAIPIDNVFTINGLRANFDIITKPKYFNDNDLYFGDDDIIGITDVDKFCSWKIGIEDYYGVGIGNKNVGGYVAGVLGFKYSNASIKGETLIDYDVDYYGNIDTVYTSTAKMNSFGFGIPVGLKIGGFAGTEKIKLSAAYKFTVSAMSFVHNEVKIDSVKETNNDFNFFDSDSILNGLEIGLIISL